MLIIMFEKCSPQWDQQERTHLATQETSQHPAHALLCTFDAGQGLSGHEACGKQTGDASVVRTEAVRQGKGR